jgi:hypothetical protein
MRLSAATLDQAHGRHVEGRYRRVAVRSPDLPGACPQLLRVGDGGRHEARAVKAVRPVVLPGRDLQPAGAQVLVMFYQLGLQGPALVRRHPLDGVRFHLKQVSDAGGQEEVVRQVRQVRHL